MVNSKRDLPFTPAEKAIITTILYSDIFSFPLTRDELWKFLLSERKITQAAFDSGLKRLQQVVCIDGYYCLKNRERIIVRRQKNIAESAYKMERAHDVVKKLSAIPSILFIGVSGGLAAGDAEKKDDIDLVVITKKNTLFTTRFLVLCILQRLGIRRKRNQKNAADRICVNLLFDETAIGWFGQQIDVYTAREIAQIVPLFERDDMYQRFLEANSWIRQFFPNVLQKVSFRNKQKFKEALFYRIFLNSFTEAALYILQTQWMKRHKTKEVVTKHLLAFHPNDYRIFILKKLRLKMRQFGLLTKF